MRPDSFRAGFLDVVLEPHLDWQCYRIEAWRAGLFKAPDRIVAGRESYPQLVYALTVKDHVLDTDPGPLDARVP